MYKIIKNVNKWHILCCFLCLGLNIIAFIFMLEAIRMDNLKVNIVEYVMCFLTVTVVCWLSLILYFLLDNKVKKYINKVATFFMVLFLVPFMYFSIIKVDELIKIGLMAYCILALSALFFLLIAKHLLEELNKKIALIKYGINYIKNFNIKKIKKHIKEAVKNEYKI